MASRGGAGRAGQSGDFMVRGGERQGGDVCVEISRKPVRVCVCVWIPTGPGLPYDADERSDSDAGTLAGVWRLIRALMRSRSVIEARSTSAASPACR